MIRTFVTIGFLAITAVIAANSPQNASQLFQSAKSFDEANQFDKALAQYLRADSAFLAAGLDHSPEFAQSLHNTGRAYFNTQNVSKGREYTLKAANLRQQLFGKTSKEYITSLNNYALSFFLAGEHQDALKHQTEVINLCRQLQPAHPDEGMYLINLGRIYHSLQKEQEAIRYMEEALPKVEKFSTNYEYILNFLSMTYMNLGDNDNVFRIMELTDEHNRHELEKECNDPECHLERAEYYMSSGVPAKAKEEYLSVLAMPLTSEQEVKVYTNYARFLSNQRDYAQAGEYYVLAAKALEQSKGLCETMASLLRQSGLCFFIGKQYDKAINAHRRVIALVDKNNYSEQLKSSSLQGLGNAFSAKKDYANAISTFNQWIKHLQAHNHTVEADYAKAYERLASAEKFNGNYDESLAHYDIAIDLYGKLGLSDEQQYASNGKTMCLTYAHRPAGDVSDSGAAHKQRNEKINRTLQESLNLRKQAGLYLGKLSDAQTLATIAGCYYQLGDYDNALNYFEKYIPAIREAIAEDFLLKTPNEREQTWLNELSNISQMNSMIEILPEAPELSTRLAALIYNGQLISKGILLTSNVEFDKVLDRNGTKEMKAKYARIKNNLENIAKMRQEHQPTDKILALVRETDALQLSLAKESAAYDDYMRYIRITSDDILPQLADNAAAIEFATVDIAPLSSSKNIIATVLSKEFPQGKLIAISTVKDIQTIISDPNRFANNEFGNKIWGELLKTIDDKTTIYFAPDGLLNNIGIEYLSVNGKPLFEQYEVSRLSSTRELGKEHLPHPVQYAALFGGIDYLEEGIAPSGNKKSNRTSDGFSFPNLENTKREVDDISVILKNHTKKTYKYTGAKAGKFAFLTQDSKKPLSLLHIATHGKYIDNGKASEVEAMNNSILAFAGANLYIDLKDNDGIVTAAEIADMSLTNCELVVLSACESGLGKLGSDGVFGLQRGFKNAGAKTLLVSLNEVADASTADMMIAFYRYLCNSTGITKREALKKAQAETRTKHPDDNTWASFILIDSFN